MPDLALREDQVVPQQPGDVGQDQAGWGGGGHKKGPKYRLIKLLFIVESHFITESVCLFFL